MIIDELIIQKKNSHIPLVWMQWVSRNWGWTTLLYLVRGAEEIFPGLKVETAGKTSKTKTSGAGVHTSGGREPWSRDDRR